METDELEAMLEGKTLIDFRVERAFKKLDKDSSGYIDRKEITEFMKESLG